MVSCSLEGAEALVLGGAGFIGRNLSIELVRAGVAVHVIGRGTLPAGLPPSIVWHDCALETTALVPIVRSKDFIFHLAGTSSPALSNRSPERDVAESLLPTLHLLEACRDAGSGRIIFASSGGTVYGLTDPQPVDERHPTEPITAYGINKLACEKYLAMYNRLYQLDTLSLRIANPFGPYQNRERAQGVVGAMLWRALAGEPIRIFGDGTVTRDYIFVGDVVAALLAAAEYRGQGRLFNIGSGRGRTLREVAASVRALAGSGAAPILYEEGRAADVPYNVLDSSAFTAATGWAAKVEWQEGLAATAAWIREEMRRPSSQAAPERYFSSVP